MARKMRPVTVLKQTNNPVPTRLIDAVERSERDMLVVLRRRLAAVVDGNSVGMRPTALAALVKQLRDVDAEIRRIDARAAALAAAQADAGDGGDDRAGWDPSEV